MTTLISDLKFACLDTETTGLSPTAGGKICELAVSVSQNGCRLEQFSTLLNPGIPMHPDVIAIHGITNEMVASAPRFEEIVPHLMSILEGCVFVAHNADFDLGFLRAEMQACGCRLPEYPVLDTLKLARKNGCFPRNSLGVIAQTLGIDAQGAHRALADVLMTEKVLACFLQDLARAGITDWDGLNACQLKKHPAVKFGLTPYKTI